MRVKLNQKHYMIIKICESRLHDWKEKHCFLSQRQGNQASWCWEKHGAAYNQTMQIMHFLILLSQYEDTAGRSHFRKSVKRLFKPEHSMR